ncbi:MAG: TonB-dependent receptor [Candidatus Eisenbacteria sp.]|nr:TonB-dependent receptor [Candidatus Eisenbacteria bacterium]
MASFCYHRRDAGGILLAVLLSLVLGVHPSSGGSILSGRIIDAETNKPVSDCYGYVEGEGWAFVTDKEGRFAIQISNLPAFIKTRHVAYRELIYTIQDEGDLDQEIVLRIVPGSYVLEPVQVTESRFRMDPERTPAPLSVISREQISHESPINVGQLLTQVPGVELEKTGPWSARPVIRGLGGDRVLVLVDGHRLNQPRGHGAQPSLVDIESVERVEILRGSASALYGSEAMGGVINIVTKSGRGHDAHSGFGGGINLIGRTADEQLYGRLDLHGRTGPLSFEVGVSGRSVNELRTPEGAVPNSDFSDLSADAAVRLRIGDRHRFRISLQHYRAEDIGIPAFNTADLGSGRFPFKEREFLEASYTLENVRKWLPKVGASVYRQGINSRFEENRVDSLFFGVGLGKRFIGWRVLDEDRHSDLETLGERVEAVCIAADALLVTLGIENVEDEVGGPNSSHEVQLTPDGAVRYDGGVVEGAAMPDAVREVRSAFLQSELQIRSLLLLTLGGRYDWARTRTDLTEGSPVDPGELQDERLSVKLGAKVDVTKWLGLTGALGTGFKIPSLQERYYNGTVHGGLMLFGNEDLVSEKTLTADLGARLTLNHLRGRADLFRTWADDLITVQYLTLLFGRPRFQYFNVDKAIIEGFETELTWNPHRRLEVSAALAWLRGDDVSNAAFNEGERTPLPSMPPVKCVLRLTYRRPVGWGALSNLWIEPRARIVGDRKRVAVNEPASPGFTVYDVRVGMEVGSSLEVTLAVENATNKLYREPLSFVTEAERNFVVGVRSKF